MSGQRGNMAQLENVDQSLLTVFSADGQGIEGLRDEEVEAVIGGGAINPSWAKPINKVGHVADKVSHAATKVKDMFRK
jgi:hypothetical protein